MQLAEAIKQHDNRAITTEQFTEIVKEHQKQGTFWVPIGKNQSRFGFLHNLFSEKGQFFQNTLKRHILQEINRIHNSGLKDTDLKHLYTAITTIHFSWRRFYDKDAFVYADPRLKAIEAYLKSYISKTISDTHPHNHDFIFKTIDIILGLAKEDVYYRARLIDIANTFKKTYPDTNKPCNLSDIEQFLRGYILTNFTDAGYPHPYKSRFMSKLVDIIIFNSNNSSLLIDFIDNYRKNFPDMLLAPGEIDNIRRWH